MDWQELTDLTRGQPFVVERVRLAGSGIVVEGQFEPPQLAQLSIDDQVFVAAFVRSHGSIKEMERIFGVSYPTIKSRLNRIAEHLDFVDTDPAPTSADVVDRLRRGEISAQEALAELEQTSMMPQLVTVRYRRSDGRWLCAAVPVLPVLLLLSPLLLLAGLAGLVACLVTGVSPAGALRGTGQLLLALRGTQIELDDGQTAVRVSVR